MTRSTTADYSSFVVQGHGQNRAIGNFKTIQEESQTTLMKEDLQTRLNYNQ